MRARLLKFTLNKKNVAARAIGPEVRSMVHKAAQDAKEIAQSIAPVDSGEYKSSFAIRTSIVLGIGDPPMARIGARLSNDSPHALIVEKGTERVHRGKKVTTPAFNVFTKTMRTMGQTDAVHLSRLTGRRRGRAARSAADAASQP